jgi:predicted RNA methylase
MPTLTHEQTINTALGEVLQNYGRDWNIRSEQVGRIFEEGGRPDILIEKSDLWPIVIEAEVGNYNQAEVEARSRLGNQLVSSPNTIHASIALVYPEELRHHDGQSLRDVLQDVNLEYALFSVEADGNTERFPEAGWLSGKLSELAVLLHRSSIPAWRVESLADALEAGVIRAEGVFSVTHPIGSALGATVADLLGQSDDELGQTRRMAMTVFVNAFVFHAALAEAEMMVQDQQAGNERPVRSPSEFREQGAFRPSLLTDEWERILEVNYWPIFHTASAILRALPTQSAALVLGVLWATAEELIVGGVTKSHDLTGVVFQRLIADRKFLATYYTRPSGAALLAGLAIPLERPIAGEDWNDAEALSTIRIGDFACGTGTLLSTAYQRVGLLHEIHGGNPKTLHPVFMQQGLVGLDVLTVAVHLTAAMLAGSHPDTPFEGECLLTMPYGRYEWGVCVGSLDLLEAQTSFEIVQAAAQTAGGRGPEEVNNLVQRIGHGQFDLVIMNPPFTRHGAREGDRTEVHNPAFAAFGADEEEQNQLAAHLRHLAASGCAHGHAGLASFFTDLAHRKTAASGTLALVLPLSSMSGKSWEGVRSVWRQNYSSILVATIAETGSHSRSFSADTGMAECLFVAKKVGQGNQAPRATFAILNRQPETTLEGELIAQAINTAVASNNVRNLEDGPFGGTRILLGNSLQGELVDCPLPSDGAWQMVGIREISLGQTAYQLAQGRLWIEGMLANDVADIPVARLGDVCQRIGPHHLDIAGAAIKADGLPQGPFEHIPGTPPGSAYPCIWNHDSSRERSLLVEPDSHCRLREVAGQVRQALIERAETRWATAARAHYNLDLRFNSQSLIVATTEQPSIGGRAWPTVIFQNPEHEIAFALWANSTLGLVAHWWASNKTQEGRGTTTVSGIPSFSTLDLRLLTAEQLEAAQNTFEALSEERFLPFNQIDEDPARAELDQRLLVDVLGLDASLCAPNGPMERLRQKLAGEPQIHSNKQTRLIFTEDGETSEPR